MPRPLQAEPSSVPRDPAEAVAALVLEVVRDLGAQLP
jgi:hypothetical protein